MMNATCGFVSILEGMGFSGYNFGCGAIAVKSSQRQAKAWQITARSSFKEGCNDRIEGSRLQRAVVRRRGADGRIPVRTLDRGASSSAAAAEPTGYPGGPYDTSLLVKYEHHVARHIWFGEVNAAMMNATCGFVSVREGMGFSGCNFGCGAIAVKSSQRQAKAWQITARPSLKEGCNDRIEGSHLQRAGDCPP
ncbi:hypothetical protein KIW84_035081 [Lathyrus oleraceus]|uniref:Uncharacterized protein n=1 Tax=Pisum sativum TaxID=3888 RepID=A0A9D4Y2V0_PEA|nr:hypothetical protein KIW84_035081 [Pisum sativum]